MHNGANSRFSQLCERAKKRCKKIDAVSHARWAVPSPLFN